MLWMLLLAVVVDPQPIPIEPQPIQVAQVQPEAKEITPRVAVVVTDPATCRPCVRLEPELTKVQKELNVYLIRSKRVPGVKQIPTTIYLGRSLVGYHKSKDIITWMKEQEERCELHY